MRQALKSLNEMNEDIHEISLVNRSFFVAAEVPAKVGHWRRYMSEQRIL